MKTFVWAIVIGSGFLSVVKVSVLALPNRKQRAATAFDALLSVSIFVWGLAVLVRG